MALVSKKRKSLDDDFQKLMLKFSLSDVKEHILSLFEDLTWEIIVKAVNKFNLSSQKEDIAKLFGVYVKNLTYDDLKEIYGHMLLLDIMLHHKKKTWTAVSMRLSDEVLDEEECVRSIIKSFRKHGKTINIYTDESDDIRWFVVIIHRKTKNNVDIYQKPIFFAYLQGYNTVFFSPTPKAMNTDTLKIIVSGFGYRDHKILKLSGKNVHSLRSMLNRHMDADKIRGDTAKALQSIENRGYVCSLRGVDFCQNEAREAHAKQMFGDESIELQTLTVNFETEWRGVRTLPFGELEEFDFCIRVKSKNVRKSLEDMVQNAVIVEPYPDWAKEFLISGKNIIDVA